jgi:hypothetical protein
MSHTVTTMRSIAGAPSSFSSVTAAVLAAQHVLDDLPGTSPSTAVGCTAYMTRENERPHLCASDSPTSAAFSSLDSSASSTTYAPRLLWLARLVSVSSSTSTGSVHRQMTMRCRISPGCGPPGAGAEPPEPTPAAPTPPLDSTPGRT